MLTFLEEIMIMIEIQGRATDWWTHTYGIPHQNNGIVHPSYINYCLKRRHFIADCVQPVIQQYKSTTVKKNFCDQSSHYENYNFRYERKPLCAYHKIDTFFVVSKDEWDTRGGGHW